MSGYNYQNRKKLEDARRSPEEQKDVATLQTEELLDGLDNAMETIAAFEKDFPGVSPKKRTGNAPNNEGRYDLVEIKQAIAVRIDRLLERFEEIQNRELEQPEPAAFGHSGQRYPQPKTSEEADVQESFDFNEYFKVEETLRSIHLHREEATRLPAMVEEIGKIKASMDAFLQTNPDAPIEKAAQVKNATSADINAAFERTAAYWQAQHAALFNNDTPEYPKDATQNADLKTISNVQQFMATYRAEDKSFALPEEPVVEKEPTIADEAALAREKIEARIAARRKAQQKDEPENGKEKTHVQKIEEARNATHEKDAGPSL